MKLSKNESEVNGSSGNSSAEESGDGHGDDQDDWKVRSSDGPVWRGVVPTIPNELGFESRHHHHHPIIHKPAEIEFSVS